MSKDNFKDKAKGKLIDIGGKAGDVFQGIKKQADKARKGIGEKFKNRSHLIVNVNDTDIKILFPDGYRQMKDKELMQAFPATKGIYYYKSAENSTNKIVVYKADSEDTFDCSNTQKMIDNAFQELSDNDVLIEVKVGESVQGYKYAYTITKTISEDFTQGVSYTLKLDIYSTDDIVEVVGIFDEAGMTGMRDSICYSLARKAGLAGEQMEGWEEYPYDSEFKKGHGRNLSEKEGIDGLFPYHPLTQARELLLSVLNNDFVIIKKEDNEEEQDEPEKKDDIELTRELFVDRCRRHRTHIDIFESKKEEQTEKEGGDTEQSEAEAENETEDEKLVQKCKLNDALKSAIIEYNSVYTILKDHGTKLFNQRERSLDLLDNIENLVNSIANHPKSFDADLQEIIEHQNNFKGVCDFAKEELDAAQKSAIGAGSGIAGGMAVAALAPSAAMWIATTFGTASTGTAISALSGAAAQSAALAWLGGGALTAGGGGMAAGNALLALAGPIGWGIAGASLLASIALFTHKKMKLDKEKKREIESVMRNTETLKETDAKLHDLLTKTEKLREELKDQYRAGLTYYNQSFCDIPEDGRLLLGTIVNNAKSLAASLEKGV